MKLEPGSVFTVHSMWNDSGTYVVLETALEMPDKYIWIAHGHDYNGECACAELVYTEGPTHWARKIALPADPRTMIGPYKISILT